MQSLSWYYQRLKSMSASEILWRVRSKLRDASDKYRFSLGIYPTPDYACSNYRNIPFNPGFCVSEVPLGLWCSNKLTEEERQWYQDLRQRADMITQHRFSFFDLKDHNLGNPIDWNRDHSLGKQSPMIYAQSIDYRDTRVAGDCKLVWEPNRHHQLVVLARAYRATGEIKYAQEVVSQIESWLDQNPFGKGMNWRSPLELSVRLINWVWALDMISDSGLFTGDFKDRILHSVYLHCWDNSRKYSQGSSANNHLIGEAAGVFIACAYFDKLPNSRKWRQQAQEILVREIQSQSYDDGCTREHALGYQIFVLQFYIFSAIAAQKIGEDFPASYMSRIETMLEFLGYLGEGGGNLPMFGDYDDGYVLDLGREDRDIGELFAIGTLLYKRPEFKSWSGNFRESVLWLFGTECRSEYNEIPALPPGGMLESRAFSDSGYYLIQSGEKDSRRRISVFFDCADLGYKSIAAHGHADALSFVLRAFGEDIFVDPGTYDYFTYPEMRNYFRSTPAHNTLALDSRDQSEMLGLFLWGERAQARLLKWDPSESGGTVSGEHNGYKRLPIPAVHRRSISLNQDSNTLVIRDDIQSEGKHEVALFFHVSDLCKVTKNSASSYEIEATFGRVFLEGDDSLSMQEFIGSESPLAGWTSNGYHRKSGCTTIIASGHANGDCCFSNTLRFEFF